jgi:hypothetical protein
MYLLVDMCLQVVKATWCKDWHIRHRQSELLKFLTIFLCMDLLPFIALMCLATSKSKLAAFHSLPISKMLKSMAS